MQESHRKRSKHVVSLNTSLFNVVLWLVGVLTLRLGGLNYKSDILFDKNKIVFDPLMGS
jgi:hypothetical protein